MEADIKLHPQARVSRNFKGYIGLILHNELVVQIATKINDKPQTSAELDLMQLQNKI